MRARLGAALLTVVLLCACIAYEAPSTLEASPGRAAPIGIYVVVTEGHPGYREEAERLAAGLRQVGFEAVVVANRGAVPPGAPFVEKYVSAWYEPELTHAKPPGLDLLTLATVGLVPTYDWQQFGYKVELHRSLTASPEPINARWSVRYVMGWLATPLAPEGYSIGPLVRVPDEAGDGREIPALGAALREALK